MSIAFAPRHRSKSHRPGSPSSRPRPSEAEKIFQALRQSPYWAHWQLRVVEHQGEIVLQGRVGSFFHKQMAQELARRCSPQAKIDNRIEVCYRGF